MNCEYRISVNDYLFIKIPNFEAILSGDVLVDSHHWLHCLEILNFNQQVNLSGQVKRLAG